MQYGRLILVALLDATIVIHNSPPCSSSSLPPSYTFFDWGDIEDFMKFIHKYQTSSQTFPSTDKDENYLDEAKRSIFPLVTIDL